jgi:hypothetical protein
MVEWKAMNDQPFIGMADFFCNHKIDYGLKEIRTVYIKKVFNLTIDLNNVV